MKHADLAIMFQESVRLDRRGIDPDAYARPRPSWLSRAGDVVRDRLDRHRQRRTLGMLDDRLLKDIGLNRIDVVQEIAKPFWRP